MDFRNDGFSIDGKSILIDGDPWELNPGSDMFICSYRFKRSKHNDGIETLPFWHCAIVELENQFGIPGICFNSGNTRVRYQLFHECIHGRWCWKIPSHLIPQSTENGFPLRGRSENTFPRSELWTSERFRKIPFSRLFKHTGSFNLLMVTGMARGRHNSVWKWIQENKRDFQVIQFLITTQ